MSQRQVFTFGYAGVLLGAFLHVVEQIDATLLDCRYSPRSRRPEWSGVTLRRQLGSRYLHVKDWGNPLYKGTRAHWPMPRAAWRPSTRWTVRA